MSSPSTSRRGFFRATSRRGFFRVTSRRGFFRAAAAVAGTTVAAGVTATAGPSVALADPSFAPRFEHGVASGDPLPRGVILWTRVTPSADATPGSGRGAATTVQWTVARDSLFTSVVATGSVSATSARDHTVKVDVSGLAPGTDYYYRFTAAGVTSPIGRTRTAPDAGVNPGRVRFGVVSCANWEAGYFGSYRHLAHRGDLDAIVHLGDYLYEYERGKYVPPSGAVRSHEPAHEIVTLADYRIRHGQYKTDPDLQALHARLPWVVTWDDHESSNDAYADGAENHDPDTEGDWHVRLAAATQAYLEWMPVRTPADGKRLYRRLQFGSLAELSMLDLRTYRDAQVSPVSEWRGVDDPSRSITGEAQMQWLQSGVSTSSAQWSLIGNPVMIAPVLVPPLDPNATRAITELLGVPASGIPYNIDQWDGYQADRRRLFETLASSGKDTVFLTGDIHTSWSADLPLEAAHYPVGRTVGTEMVVPSVTSSNINEMLRVPPRTASVAIEGALQSVNRHLTYVELDSHGYGVFEVTADAAQMDWYFLDNIADPHSGVRLAASRRAAAGGGRSLPTASALVDDGARS
ncbi:MAG: alkaline phosphatase [Rhodococcus sp.]|nr:alkaline phosphatase [Rhodococcus sp. (in: high G+C Gram-positive bacteria)]